MHASGVVVGGGRKGGGRVGGGVNRQRLYDHRSDNRAGPPNEQKNKARYVCTCCNARCAFPDRSFP